MKRLTWSLALVAVCVWGLPTPATAQITGTIRGVVTDSQGGVLPGATVTADSPNLHRSDVFATTVSGRGELLSFGIVWRTLHPAFASQVPLCLCSIRLVEGPTVLALLEEYGPGEPRIGMPV